MGMSWHRERRRNWGSPTRRGRQRSAAGSFAGSVAEAWPAGRRSHSCHFACAAAVAAVAGVVDVVDAAAVAAAAVTAVVDMPVVDAEASGAFGSWRETAGS